VLWNTGVEITMPTQAHQLVKLGDSDLTLAHGEEDVRGRKVVDERGNDVGTVESLFIDRQQGRVRFLEVQYGDFLGLGGSSTLVPVEAVREVGDPVRLGHARETVAGAPPYDPKLQQAPQWEDISGYYGLPPYGAGAVYPPGTVRPLP
jgi:sporulation protein YlmC with PRC-barrel domain